MVLAVVVVVWVGVGVVGLIVPVAIPVLAAVAVAEALPAVVTVPVCGPLYGCSPATLGHCVPFRRFHVTAKAIWHFYDHAGGSRSSPVHARVTFSSL